MRGGGGWGALAAKSVKLSDASTPFALTPQQQQRKEQCLARSKTSCLSKHFCAFPLFEVVTYNRTKTLAKLILDLVLSPMTANITQEVNLIRSAHW